VVVRRQRVKNQILGFAGFRFKDFQVIKKKLMNLKYQFKSSHTAIQTLLHKKRMCTGKGWKYSVHKKNEIKVEAWLAYLE